MDIYIVRHGQTAENKLRMLQGHLPGHLTETGKEQVRQAAEQLAKENITLSRIVTSDLKRALDSANIIAERLHLPVTATSMLRERDWGNYTGISLEEATEKYKKDGKWTFPDGSAETEEQILCRAKVALEKLKHEYDGENIVVVTHGQFARNMMAAYLGCGYHDVPPFANAEIRKLTL